MADEERAKESEGINIVSYIKSREGNLSSEEIWDIISELTKEHQKAVLNEKRAKIERMNDGLSEELRRKIDEVAAESPVMELPLDYENLFHGDERSQGVHTDSISDALVLSLHNIGRVDIEYISSITGRQHTEIITALKGSIYQNPEKMENCFYKGWETADEYLSGNLRRKYAFAKAANERTGMFSENLEALGKIMPPAVKSNDIYITLGSPWVPTWIIDEFIFHLFGRDDHYDKEYYYVKHYSVRASGKYPQKADSDSIPARTRLTARKK